MNESSLRLRPLVSFVLFLSAYSPLMVILAIKDMNISLPHFFNSPTASGILIFMAIGSSFLTILTVRSVENGIQVVVT